MTLQRWVMHSLMPSGHEPVYFGRCTLQEQCDVLIVGIWGVWQNEANFLSRGENHCCGSSFPIISS